MTDKMIYSIGLTMIDGVGEALARKLLEFFGEAEAVFTEKKYTLDKVPRIGRLLAGKIKDPGVLQRAEKEMDFIEKNQIRACFITDKEYPARLKECADAPLLFYFKGNADLNAARIISIVGTRSFTDYGRETTDKLIRDLAVISPGVLIISGLAYGIDIQAHRASLKNNLPTVAVLAHGLDRIYPSVHRYTAMEMLQQGGLLTDFPSGTNLEKFGFVRRNRIVAGLSDATVVTESPEKGGSLITADIAFSYGREVFSFPGRTTDVRSQGCNTLIRQNKAALITSAADLALALGWETPHNRWKKPVMEPRLPFPGDETYEPVLSILRENREIHINQLATTTGMPVNQLTSLLFELELNDRVKVLPGGIYRWV